MKKNLISTIGLCCLLAPGIAFAEAGSTLRQYKETTVLSEERKTPEEIKYTEEGEAQIMQPQVEQYGPALFVSAIHVVGNTALSEEEVHQVISPYTNRNLTTAEIHEAADALMAAIRKAGAFIAKVYILPQDVTDATITFNVIEGHLAKNGIVLGKSSERVSDKILLRQLEYNLEPGTVITSRKYERAIYLTNDLPGILGTENLIFPAENVGEAGFETIPEDEKPVTGDVYYDNFGSYFTGRHRWGGTVNLNSPTGHAEKLTAGANVSDYGTVYGYLDGDLLLFPNGMRGGATLSYLDYSTDEENDLRGNAFDGSLYLHYPVIRSRLTNLYSRVQYTYTDLMDENDLTTITERRLNVASLQLSGDVSDSVLGGGVTTARLEGYAGHVDLSDYEPFEEYDAEHADTQGGFSRATLSLSRMQHLIGKLQGNVAFNGQIASKNMDPSQSISFGGPFDFPGYHAGEIMGDEGWMVHTDLRYTFNSLPWQGELQLSVFYDYGWIESHTVAIVDGFAVPGAVHHSFHLQSAGFGVSQSWQHVTLQGTIGWQLDNEIPDELLDDGGDDDFQGWVHLVYTF